MRHLFHSVTRLMWRICTHFETSREFKPALSRQLWTHKNCPHHHHLRPAKWLQIWHIKSRKEVFGEFKQAFQNWVSVSEGKDDNDEHNTAAKSAAALAKVVHGVKAWNEVNKTTSGNLVSMRRLCRGGISAAAEPGGLLAVAACLQPTIKTRLDEGVTLVHVPWTVPCVQEGRGDVLEGCRSPQPRMHHCPLSNHH